MTFLFLLGLLFPVIRGAYLDVDSDNVSLNSSVTIEHPTAHSLIYSDFFAPNEVHYYSFDLVAGEELSLGLFKPIDDDAPLLPIAALILGPAGQALFNLPVSEFGNVLPVGTEIPSDVAAGLLFAPAANETEYVYESFVPSSYAQYATRVRVNATQDARFHVLVFHTQDFGQFGYPVHFGVEIGSQSSFTATQLVSMPVDSFVIHAWEGQHTPELIIPVFLAAVSLVGILLFRSLWLQSTPATITEWLLSLGGAMYWVSAINYWYQMLRAASLTGEASAEPVLTLVLGGVHAVFSVGPLIVGLDSLDRNGEFVWWWRLLLIAQSVGSLFVFGAGYYLGPILVFIAACTPDGIGYTTMRELVYGPGEEVAYYYDDFYYELITVPPTRPVRQSHRSSSRVRRNRQGWNY